jgi:hypothetical protein
MTKLLLQALLISFALTLAVVAFILFAPDDIPDQTRTTVCLAIMGVGCVVGGVWLGLKTLRQQSARRVRHTLPARGGVGGEEREDD